MGISIAIVEDEIKLAEVLQSYLQREGYSTQIYSDGDEALLALQKEDPSLVLLDLMLPSRDGMSVCSQLRKTSNVPIIMLTARIEEIDRLLGLELGADDYICKPFSPREVVARVKAVLRRTGSLNATKAATTDNNQQRQLPSTNNLLLDTNTASVSVNANTCALTAVEMRLLSVLIERPGQIFNRTQLMQRMYEDSRIVSDRTIDSHIKKLRQKLELLDEMTSYIHSVYGIGYKYEIMGNAS